LAGGGGGGGDKGLNLRKGKTDELGLEVFFFINVFI
jgi:hypothetical protein